MKGNYARLSDGVYTGLLGKGSDLVSGGGSTDFAIRSDSAILFSYGSAERARIDSSGNLLVGTTSNTYVSRSVLSAPSTNNVLELIQGASSGYSVIFTNTAGSVGSIQTTSVATLYVTSSDYRLKENIVPMTGALAKVAQLKPVTYKWKSNGSDGQGFIAHELAEVVPDCVSGEKDAVDKDGKPKYQGVDTSFLVATLVSAIQELKAEFDAYKATHP
jgi:hypothetical protein